MNYCADGFAHRHPHYIAPPGQVEDADGQLVVAAHGHRRGVNHRQVAGQHFAVSDLTGSPIDIRIILPRRVKLKTRMGSLLSRHMATAEASITARSRASTSL